MSSDLWIKQGIYDPTKRFAFTNIADKPFTFTWNKTPITVKAGEEIELPHHLAVLATTQLVDQIMQDDVKQEEEKMKVELRNPQYRSHRAMSAGIPAMRKPIEDKICRELKPNESKITESQLGIIRAELKEKIMDDIKKSEPAAPISGSVMAGIIANDVKATEFQGVNKK